MKKLIIFVFCMLSIVASADDVTVALLEPLTVPGSTECTPMEISMVRGELRKAFARQSGFQPLARMDVDAMLKEQGFQRSGVVDDKQIKEIGKMTSAQYICVSKITKYKTQLYIESYLVDVETGGYGLTATQYVNVRDEDYSTLSTACLEMAQEMVSGLGGKIKSSDVSYDKAKQMEEYREEYVDLGLPSGTLWKAENEDCGLITYDQAYNFYGSSLPTKEQWEELIKHCIWIKNKDDNTSYTIKGRNGKSIFLPSSLYGFICHNNLFGPKAGHYWSSTQDDSVDAWGLCFYTDDYAVNMVTFHRRDGKSIRLVK